MPAILDFISLRLRDLVDVVLIAFLLYTLIIWARRLRSSRIVSGLGTLAFIYIIARLLELQLTVWVFQGLFAVLALVLVVIFQAELRQLFERLAAWEFPGSEGTQVDLQVTEPLVAALSKLASSRIGALVVVPGRDAIEAHVGGGIAVDAAISAPLIESLFDPHSAGHDGALLLKDNRVSHFAVHLPLSTDFTQLRDRGTRHAAALGLVERTDALCIVVSEERGRISVARDSRIDEVEGAPELTASIESFLKENTVPPPQERRKRILTLRRNWPEKLVSLLLALVAWVAFVSDFGLEQRIISVPVVIQNVPANLRISRLEPQQVSVVFRATRQSFNRLDTGLVGVTLTSPPATAGESILRIESADVLFPDGLEFVDVDPEIVRLELIDASDPL